MRTLHYLFLILLAISACSHLQPSPSPDIIVSVEEPARMRFHGKGAGAGMMLMASMGPMGVAVGVAIDEGIGKDIDKSAKAVGFNIEAIIEDAFENAANSNSPSEKIKQIKEIKILRYGFVTRPGDNDPVAAQQHLRVVFADGSDLFVKYPEDVAVGEVVMESLDKVKVDGALAKRMHRNAASILAERSSIEPD